MEFVKLRSKLGYPVWTGKPTVPRVDDSLLNTVIFLYRSAQEAEDGVRLGGTGFLVRVPIEGAENHSLVYAVSNRHVVFEGSSPVIRINTMDDRIDIVDVPQEVWEAGQQDDLAILPIKFDTLRHRISVIPTKNFVTKQMLSQLDIGPGEDTFMVGRFVDHEGVQKNLPTIRFGNIAMMPWEPLSHEILGEQESFLVEMRSLSGYSGSPVLVWNTTTTYLRPKGRPEVFGPYLLGIDWGHIFAKQSVRNEVGDELPQKWHVRSVSGMVGVVPAWKLEAMLNGERQKALRREILDQIRKAESKQASGIPLDAATEGSPAAGDEILRRMLNTPPKGHRG